MSLKPHLIWLANPAQPKHASISDPIVVHSSQTLPFLKRPLLYSKDIGAGSVVRNLKAEEVPSCPLLLNLGRPEAEILGRRWGWTAPHRSMNRKGWWDWDVNVI